MSVVDQIKPQFTDEDRLLLNAYAEIERLQEEKKVIATHGLKQIAEIERLREALKEIAALDEVSVDEFKLNQWLHQRIARTALKGDE